MTTPREPTQCAECGTTIHRQPKRGPLRKFCEACKHGRIVASRRESYLRNIKFNEAVKAERRDTLRQWRAENREHVRSYARDYYYNVTKPKNHGTHTPAAASCTQAPVAVTATNAARNNTAAICQSTSIDRPAEEFR